jgi:ATP-binding cassette subfamily B protein
MNDSSGGTTVAPPPAALAPAPPRKAKLRPLRLIVPYVMRHPGRVAAAFIALLAASAATLVVPIAVRRMIDFGFDADHIELINRYFGVMIAVVAVLAIASAGRFYLVTSLGERVVTDLRAAVFDHLIHLSSPFFDTAKTGELLSRLTSDVTQLRAAVSVVVPIALRNFVLFVGSAAMMVVTSPKLSGFVLAAIPVIVLPLVAFGRSVRRRTRAAQDALAEAIAYTAQLLGAVRVLQAFTNERLAATYFARAIDRAYRTAIFSTQARAVLTCIVIFLAAASIVAVLWVGAHDVMAGTLSRGRLSQFVLFAVLAASGLVQLSEVWNELSQTAGSAERLAELLAIEPQIRAPAHPVALPSRPRAELAFRNVRFAYESQPQTNVLDDVSFHVRAGEKIAIVGPSGAGKSTIFHLILRFYDPTSGAVTFDGVRLTDADPTQLRTHIALVPQEPTIFGMTVRDNIRFGRPDASNEDIERASDDASAAPFIRALPDGYDTPIGERGVTLSGGQRQRLAIARAILRSAPLLLLDEATSSLDAESETLVQAALARLMTDRTTLVIAHRLATVLNCDRILVLDHGRIVEQGTHEALVANGGLYARLAKLQFQTG